MDKIEKKRLGILAAVKRYQDRNRDKVKAYQLLYRRRNYDSWVEFLKGLNYVKCSKCGYDKCFAALDFHHTGNDRYGDKSRTIAQMLGNAITDKNKHKLLEELKKCDILCANYHRELHNRG